MWTVSDRAGNGEWYGVWFPGFFLILVSIYFRQLNDELDKHNKEIF